MNGREVLLLWAVVVLGIAWTGAPAGGTAVSSDRCGTCHTEIYRTWRKSAHSRSMEEPRFLSAFRRVQTRDGEAAARVCLPCHAPLTQVNNDWDLKYRTTWEGVTCEVCHSMVSIDDSVPNPVAHYDIRGVKYGPIEDAESSEHEVAFSPLHSTSLVCAPCHEHVRADGTPLLSTYTEWKGSSAARDGKECQHCHMSKTKANVVDPRVARVERAEINLHDVPGGHSPDHFQKALKVTVRPVREADTLVVEVRIRNVGAGHSVPTGMPGRRVILSLEVRSRGEPVERAEKTYARIFADTDGNQVLDESRYFEPGLVLQADTRLAADEERLEVFRFPGKAAASVKTQLRYEHTPTSELEDATSFLFFSLTQSPTASR